MATEEHVDVSVKQSMTPGVILQGLGLLGICVGIYSNMSSNDREHSTEIRQLQANVSRLERDTKDLKAEILVEIREMRAELRSARERGSK